MYIRNHCYRSNDKNVIPVKHRDTVLQATCDGTRPCAVGDNFVYSPHRLRSTENTPVDVSLEWHGESFHLSLLLSCLPFASPSGVTGTI